MCNLLLCTDFLKNSKLNQHFSSVHEGQNLSNVQFVTSVHEGNMLFKCKICDCRSSQKHAASVVSPSNVKFVTSVVLSFESNLEIEKF